MHERKVSSPDRPVKAQHAPSFRQLGLERQELAARAREPRHVAVAEWPGTEAPVATGEPDTSGGNGPKSALRVLLVEDSPEDAALLLHELRRGGYEPLHMRVDTAEALREALSRQEWDVVFSDHAMPEFSAPEALEIVKETGLQAPFIIVSGTIGEETAVEAMRAGADDYLVKGRLARLVPAMQRGLQSAAERRARQRAEEAVHRAEAILRAVVGAAEKLLRNAEWEQSIQEVLGGLGRAMEVSRIYVLQNRDAGDDAIVTELAYEWVSPGLPAPIPSPAGQRFSSRAGGLPRAVEALSRGETFYAHVAQLPPAERKLLAGLGVSSVALVPIFVGQRWWGVIGFDEPSSERDWSTAELDALKAAADTLGAAIQRRQMEEHSERQVRRLAGLRAINLATTASLDLEVTLNVFLEQATAQLGVDAAGVLLFRPESERLDFLAGRGFRTPAFQHTKLPLGQGYAGRAALKRRSVSVPDLRHEPGDLTRAHSLAGEAFVAYYAIPLLSRGELRGVLELFHRSPLDLAPEWVEFAETLASQAAVAIDHALLFEDLQSSALAAVETRSAQRPAASH